MRQELNKVNEKLDKMAATMCNKFTQLNDTLKEVSDKLNRLETVEASVRSLEHNKEINEKAQVNEVVQEKRNKGKSKKKGKCDSSSSPRNYFYPDPTQSPPMLDETDRWEFATNS
jgi:sensor c-di-GMP phosphodiesterase-like protein